MNRTPIENQSELRIGVVEYTAPNEIKVQLDIEAPDGIAANAGVPRAFPRINGYVLLPNDSGHIVCQIVWIAIERSPFPKRKGYQDYGLVDLPYPIRKMKIVPLGILKTKEKQRFVFQRGVQSFPSVGTPVLLPTDEQLKSIIESGKNRRVYIGNSPLAANAEVKIDPDRLFGRHLAVLGNTGSGKSCTVAGLIQWSLESAKKELEDESNEVNARFVILDPNGEYSKVFENAKVLKVGDDGNYNLDVPLWLWNSAEFGAFTEASSKAQLPLLKRALREIKQVKNNDNNRDNQILELRRKISSIWISLNSQLLNGNQYEGWKFGPKLNAFKIDFEAFARDYSGYAIDLGEIYQSISDIIKPPQSYTKQNGDIGYKDFPYTSIEPIINKINNLLIKLGGVVYQSSFNEDTPIPYNPGEFVDYFDYLIRNESNPQFFEFLIARIRTMLSDARMNTIIGDKKKIKLDEWLEKYLGKDDKTSITIIDLSLVPSEIIHIITSVIARVILEALQRYRKIHKKALPTVLVMEEAHSFITRYTDINDRNSSAICTKVFEKIAREGRKFGMSLVLSSQRPSELSQTVLSQCNSFILHRISNDRDQELVGKLLPDNFRGLLNELPSLPSQQAILLGWASELPILVKIRDLPKEERPLSDDPDFWNVWRRVDNKGDEIQRKINWKEIADDWQEKSTDG